MQEKLKKTKKGELTYREYAGLLLALSQKTFLTIDEVCDLYGMSRPHVLRIMGQPDADFSYFIGKRRAIDRQQFDDFIRSGLAKGV